MSEIPSNYENLISSSEQGKQLTALEEVILSDGKKITAFNIMEYGTKLGIPKEVLETHADYVDDPHVNAAHKKNNTRKPAQIQSKKKGNTKAKPAESKEDQAVLELNVKHAAVMAAGAFTIINEERNPETGEIIDITFSNRASFNAYYENQTIPVRSGKNTKYYTKSSLWLKSPLRRTKDKIVFEPSGQAPDNCYNLFRGLPIKPVKGDWGLIRDHIADVICDGNARHYNYLKAWLANLFQSRGANRPGTATVLRGVQGSGKGCFVSVLQWIFGPYFKFTKITQPAYAYTNT